MKLLKSLKDLICLQNTYLNELYEKYQGLLFELVFYSYPCMDNIVLVMIQNTCYNPCDILFAVSVSSSANDSSIVISVGLPPEFWNV